MKEMLLIWKEPISRRRFIIGNLSYDGIKYIFKYTNPEVEDAKKYGFEFYPGFQKLNKIYESEQLFPNIETRLPNPLRPDYLEILNSYGLEKDSTKLQILCKTKGRLITDNYEFVPSFDKHKIEFEIAGTRHSNDTIKCKEFLSINKKLYLILDDNNKYDENAVKVIYKCNNKDYELGYVPRYYSKELKKILKENIKYSAMIESLNFDSNIRDEDITVSVKLIFE